MNRGTPTPMRRLQGLASDRRLRSSPGERCIRYASTMTGIQGFTANVHSQHGDDGLLAEIFKTLEVVRGYFVEFGAWDGKHLSNCHTLYEDGWAGCYIEGDPVRYKDLERTITRNDVSKVEKFVSESGADSLDSILRDVGAPQKPDLLSVDVDGDDLAIWRGLTQFRPRCVIIEYNPTIPFDTRFENQHGQNWGNSARSIYEFASGAQYALIAYTSGNLIFIDKLVGDVENFETLTLNDIEVGNRYFWGYDGTLLIARPGDDENVDPAPEFFRLPWVGTVMKQPLPRVFRGYHDEVSLKVRARKLTAAASVSMSRPISMLREMNTRHSR